MNEMEEKRAVRDVGELMEGPYPPEVMPKILDAARECGGDAYPLVAGLMYTGMHPEIFGLRVKDLWFEEGIIRKCPKDDRCDVVIIFHKRLIEIWKEHLENRDYESEMLFRLGEFQFLTEDSDEEDWTADASNRRNVKRLLLQVEEELSRRGIDEHLTTGRFRCSVLMYLRKYGLNDKDLEMVLMGVLKTRPR
ncbi:MAG: site-specific integrase [Candidatus Thermoplasmatota archaeon]|nr:site-specific integrase [Candidatus Thermoplasmatota archaeon]